MPTLRRRILALACLSALQPAFAQAPDAPAASPAADGYVPGGRIPRLQGDIAIDGKLDDAAWQGALVQEIAYDIQPGDNTPAPVKTIVRIGYTDDALYVAYHALDPDPASIRAHLRDRDAAFNDDWVGLFLDTFSDHRRGYELVSNRSACRATSSATKPTATTRKTRLGRAVEQRRAHHRRRLRRGDAHSLLHPALPARRRRAALGHLAVPQLAARQAPPADQPPGAARINCFECEWGRYTGLAGAQQGRNLEIVPTITIGQQQTRGAAGEAWRSDKASIEPGVDVAGRRRRT